MKRDMQSLNYQEHAHTETELAYLGSTSGFPVTREAIVRH